MVNQKLCRTLFCSIFVFLIWCTPNSLYGQFKIGFTGGINVSGTNLESTSDLFETGNRTGYFIGVLPAFRLTDNLSLIGETQLSIKGYELSSLGTIIDQETKYLNILPGIEYNILGILNLGLGVNFAYRIDESQRYNGGNWTDVKLVDDVDLGLNGTIKVNLSKVFAFVRYETSLDAVANFNVTDINGNPIGIVKLYNRNIQLGVGIMLR